MALFNEFEGFKKQYTILQQENSRLGQHITEQAQIIATLQAHSVGWQDKLDAAYRGRDDELHSKQDEVSSLFLIYCF